MQTRSELVTEFRDLIDQPNTSIVSSTKANREINRAYREIRGLINARNYRFYYTSSTVTTVASTPFVDLPSDCVFVDKLIDSDSEELQTRDMSMFNHSLDNDEPIAWDVAGRHLIFSPIPDSTYTYTIYYTYDPGDMSSDSAVPVWITGYEDVIALKAAINSKMIREEDVRDMVRNSYNDRLQALLRAVGEPPTGASRRVIISTYDIGDV